MSERKIYAIGLTFYALSLIGFAALGHIDGKHAADRWYAEHPALGPIIGDQNPNVVSGTTEPLPGYQGLSYSNGWMRTSGAWSSDNSTVVRIDGNGTVTCEHAGVAHIAYALPGQPEIIYEIDCGPIRKVSP